LSWPWSILAILSLLFYNLDIQKKFCPLSRLQNYSGIMIRRGFSIKFSLCSIRFHSASCAWCVLESSKSSYIFAHFFSPSFYTSVCPFPRTSRVKRGEFYQSRLVASASVTQVSPLPCKESFPKCRLFLFSSREFGSKKGSGACASFHIPERNQAHLHAQVQFSPLIKGRKGDETSSHGQNKNPRFK